MMDYTPTSSTSPPQTSSTTERHTGKTKILRPNQKTRRYENKTTIITGHSSSTFKQFQKEINDQTDLYNPENPSPNSPVADNNVVDMTIDIDNDENDNTNVAEPAPIPKPVHPPRNPFAPSSIHPLGIDNTDLYDIYSRNSKGEGSKLFSKTDQQQTCLPFPQLTANFNPKEYGHYATTNGAFRQHISSRYDSVIHSSKSDTSLPPVYIVNSKEELCLPPFRKVVKLHPKIIPKRHRSKLGKQKQDTHLERPELDRPPSPQTIGTYSDMTESLPWDLPQILQAKQPKCNDLNDHIETPPPYLVLQTCNLQPQTKY